MENSKSFCIFITLFLSFNSLNAFKELEIKGLDLVNNFRKSFNIEDTIHDYESYDVPEIIESFGYPVETHYVTTEDGYILGVHRIPYGLNGTSGEPRPVVVLQHGLLVSSFDWIADRPGRALAYILADAGYDVWLNNGRGNVYSRNHTTLDPDVDTEAFWTFSYDEIGMYDIPATINYALAITGADQVYYGGFSMGTTTYFIMASERPEMVDKIKAAALMAPVVYMNNIKGILKPLANYSQAIDDYLAEAGRYEVPGRASSDNDAVNKFCSEGNATAPICYSFLYVICGYDPKEMNKELYPIIMSHEPAGTSFNTINHYAQQILTDVFQKYDYGPDGNLEHYGQDTPPPLNTEGPQPPLGLFVGPNDFLATPTDVDRLREEVQNLQLYHLVNWPLWSHIDFCWGIDAREYVYDYVVDFYASFAT